MIEAVFEYIRQYNLIEQGDRVILGVSGGADSVCLFRVLLELRKKIDFQMYVVHVEHGIRGEEAIRDLQFVEKLCQNYGVECSVYHFDIPAMAKEKKLSEEEAGRMARYQAFAMEKKKISGNGRVRIAVAHHKNDNVETLLLHLIRGTGIAGLKAMEPVRNDIIRPLLFLERKEIENYLAGLSQEFCTDSTNLTTDYARNKIRLKVLPELEKINSSAIKHVDSAAAKIAKADRYLAKMVQKEYTSIVTRKETWYLLNIERLQLAEEYIQGEVVKQALYECSGSQKNITTAHIESVLGLLFRENGKQISLPYEMKAVRAYDVIQLQKETAEKDREEISVIIQEPGQYNVPYTNEKFLVTLENIPENNKKFINLEQKTYTKCFDYDKIEGSLVIRTRKTGDYLVIDEQGHRQSLKSFFINEKIERQRRNQILLVADGSHVLWIVGYRISGKYKVGKETSRIIRIQRIGEEEDE